MTEAEQIAELKEQLQQQQDRLDKLELESVKIHPIFGSAKWWSIALIIVAVITVPPSLVIWYAALSGLGF